MSIIEALQKLKHFVLQTMSSWVFELKTIDKTQWGNQINVPSVILGKTQP